MAVVIQDEYSFYAAMKDYKNGRLEKAIKKWESIRLQLMMKVVLTPSHTISLCAYLTLCQSHSVPIHRVVSQAM